MIRTIDPGKERRSINVIDKLVYSRVTDRDGNPVELQMALMLQNGNSEMRSASGRDDEVSQGLQPAIIWINGSGWRQCDKLLMSAEMQFLAEAGYAMAFIEYRHSGLGAFPAQLIDCKTAVRYLRANAEKYNIDPNRIGVIGRSAGGMLAAWMAMNTPGFDTEEWAGFSSEVQYSVDMFGPVDIPPCTEVNLEMIKKPGSRWNNISQTHDGALLDLNDSMTVEEMLERGKEASPVYYITEKAAPLTIMHGDEDPLIPMSQSTEFYDRMVAAGLEKQTDLIILRHGGHGTREFFQNSTKELIVKAFDRYLK